MLRNVDHRRGEQALFIAEEVVDHRDVDAGIGCDRAHCGLFVAALEVLSRRLDDPLLVLLTSAPSTCSSTAGRRGHAASVLQHLLMFVRAWRSVFFNNR